MTSMQQNGSDYHNGGATTATLSEQSLPERCGLIILGNSGVGKSYLANRFLQQESFVHQTSATAVTTLTEFIEYTSGNTTYMIFNIPGLVEADQEKIETNKREIGKAFEQCPNAVVIYVFGTQKGRIRNEDVIAFNALNDAYPFDKKSLVLVVNGIPRQNRASNYEGETIVLLQKMLQTELPKNICFLDDIDVNNAQEEKQLRQKLIQTVMGAVPKVHEKQHDIQLEVDTINQLKEDLSHITTQFDEQKEELMANFEEAQRLHEEELAVLTQKYQELERAKPASPNWIHDLVKPIFQVVGMVDATIESTLKGENPRENMLKKTKEVGERVDELLT